jgi:hypothetical protein
MKILLVGFLSLLCGLTAAGQSHLSPRFQTVYILPMANSLDQHLASRLTSNRVLWVVLQPAKADAVLTDTLDEEFWNWLERTYPPPAGAAANSPASAYRSSSLPAGKHQGTIFLIDPRTRVVLWSTYELPKNSSPAELDRSAARITNQLRMAFAKK